MIFNLIFFFFFTKNIIKKKYVIFIKKSIMDHGKKNIRNIYFIKLNSFIYFFFPIMILNNFVNWLIIIICMIII